MSGQGRPGAGPMRGPGGGGPSSGMGIPVEKSMNFGPSAKRLAGQLKPERLWLVLTTTLAVVSVTLSVIGPRILGESTNVILGGVVGQSLPTGATVAQFLAGLRSAGQSQQADLLGEMNFTPGIGIDFDLLRDILLLVLTLHVFSSFFGWL
jgi:ATP-binding cassette subfamily B multidrug efflux pump